MNRARFGRSPFGLVGLVCFVVFVAVLAASSASRAAQAPSVEKPVKPPAPLVLEDALNPRTTVDVSKYRGMPILIAGLCPE